AASVAWISAVVFSLILMVPAIWIRERSEYQRRRPSKPFQAIKDVYQNHHARLLLFVFFIEHHGFAVMGIISPYMALYVLKRPDLIGLLPTLFVLPSILSVPLWVWFSRRFGKRNTWLFSMVAIACAYGPMIFVQEGSEVLLGVLLVLAGLAAGCGGPIGQSLLVDIMDYDQYTTGERKEGAYSAALGFVTKLANVLVALLVGVALQVAGFEPNVEQTDTVKLTIRTLQALLPFTMFTIGFILFRNFSLDEKTYMEIRAELDQRDKQREERRTEDGGNASLK
ncbi:MAG: MFS transporter, partial [bacterium]|nr:MFS transporter [bacterium]